MFFLADLQRADVGLAGQEGLGWSQHRMALSSRGDAFDLWLFASRTTILETS